MNYESLINGAKILAIVVCIGFGLFMLFSYANIKSELTAKEYENASLQNALKKQNEAIDKLALDLSYYKSKKQEIQEKIIYKYKQIPSPIDNSCQERLSYIQSQIKLWYGVE